MKTLLYTYIEIIGYLWPFDNKLISRIWKTKPAQLLIVLYLSYEVNRAFARNVVTIINTVNK